MNTKTTTATADSNTGTDNGATPATPEVKVDPFASLPRITVGETTNVLDMSGVEGNNPFKYAKVHAAATEAKLPLMPNWKHSAAMFVPGTFKGGENGFRQGSVYGTIAEIANRAGKAGITAHEMVTLLRQRQIGNKRSKYCEKLPPVGWAEGWLNSAVTKNIIGVHATKKAPALVVPAPAADAGEGKEGQKAAA